MILIETGSDGVDPLRFELTHAQLNPVDFLTNYDYTYRVTKKRIGDAMASEEELDNTTESSCSPDCVVDDTT